MLKKGSQRPARPPLAETVADNHCRKITPKPKQRLEKPVETCRQLPTDFVSKYSPYMLQKKKTEQ